MSMTGTEFSVALRSLLERLGAVRVRIGPNGIASHWRTEIEAGVAREKFEEAGALHVETFPDNGLFAVFAKF